MGSWTGPAALSLVQGAEMGSWAMGRVGGAMKKKSASSREESHQKINMHERQSESPFVCAYFLPSKPVRNKLDRARLIKFHFINL